MTPFSTLARQRAATVIAPDGSAVRPLLGLAGGTMAEFELASGQVSTAVTHRTVSEIWYVLSGRGEIWRRHGAREEVTPLEAGIALTIPLGTHFQFRALGEPALTVLAITMPPWPGDDEATSVAGPWGPTV
jgi:mannose-6-phosphate isomerase-like protein (cupin superfamily)